MLFFYQTIDKAIYFVFRSVGIDHHFTARTNTGIENRTAARSAAAGSKHCPMKGTIGVTFPVKKQTGKRGKCLLFAALLFFFAATQLIFITPSISALDQPAQKTERILAEHETDKHPGQYAGDNDAAKVRIDNPRTQRNNHIRIHFSPPIWVVIGGAILAGVITGFSIGLLFRLLKYLMFRGNQAPGA